MGDHVSRFEALELKGMLSLAKKLRRLAETCTLE
jgi:hypothetical protein